MAKHSTRQKMAKRQMTAIERRHKLAEDRSERPIDKDVLSMTSLEASAAFQVFANFFFAASTEEARLIVNPMIEWLNSGDLEESLRSGLPQRRKVA